MWDILAGVLLKLPDLLSKLADRTKVRISVKRLEYNLIRNDPDSEVVFISPYPSRYYAEVGFSHRGKATTIRNLTLIIDGRLRLKAAGFSPLRLEHGDYCEKVIVFPVEESLAVRKGTFEIQTLDPFGKVYNKCKGRFPVDQ